MRRLLPCVPAEVTHKFGALVAVRREQAGRSRARYPGTARPDRKLSRIRSFTLVKLKHFAMVAGPLIKFGIEEINEDRFNIDKLIV